MQWPGAADVDPGMDGPRPCVCFAFCAIVGPAGSTAVAVGARGGESRRTVVPDAIGAAGRLQQRTFAAALPPAVGPQPHAPGDVFADAPRGGTAGVDGADH